MTQYSKRMVIIHWLTLALVIAAWFLGEAASDARHATGAALQDYIIHALVGGTIFLLTLARLVFRRKDGTPPLLADKPMLQTMAKGVHHLLYTLLILLPISGVIQIVTSDVGKALLAGDATLLPKKFDGVFAHEVHEILVSVLIAVVVLHIIGALKHQFINKDGVMKRISWCKKD